MRCSYVRATLPAAEAAHSYDGAWLVVVALFVVVAAGGADQLTHVVEQEERRELLGVAEFPPGLQKRRRILEMQGGVGADDEVATVTVVAVVVTVVVVAVVAVVAAGGLDQRADGVEPELLRDLLRVEAERCPREPEPLPGVLEIQGDVVVDDEVATGLAVVTLVTVAVAVGVGDSGDCQHCRSREDEDDALHIGTPYRLARPWAWILAGALPAAIPEENRFFPREARP